MFVVLLQGLSWEFLICSERSLLKLFTDSFLHMLSQNVAMQFTVAILRLSAILYRTSKQIFIHLKLEVNISQYIITYCFVINHYALIMFNL